MNIPKELKYTKTNEWILQQEDYFTIGITDYAQDELSDVVYIELPKIHIELQAGNKVAIVESVKAASEIYSPISGKVTEVNVELLSNPSLLNTDPFGAGWIYKMQASKLSEILLLLSPEAYQIHIGQ